VRQNLGLQTEVADSLAVFVRLGRRDRACKLDIIDAKIIEHGCDLDLVLGGEEGVGELLALSQSALDDLVPSNIADVVLDLAVGRGSWVLVRRRVRRRTGRSIVGFAHCRSCRRARIGG
jgi:hypothetical protein